MNKYRSTIMRDVAYGRVFTRYNVKNETKKTIEHIAMNNLQENMTRLLLVEPYNGKNYAYEVYYNPAKEIPANFKDIKVKQAAYEVLSSRIAKNKANSKIRADITDTYLAQDMVNDDKILKYVNKYSKKDVFVGQVYDFTRKLEKEITGQLARGMKINMSQLDVNYLDIIAYIFNKYSFLFNIGLEKELESIRKIAIKQADYLINTYNKNDLKNNCQFAEVGARATTTYLKLVDFDMELGSLLFVDPVKKSIVRNWLALNSLVLLKPVINRNKLHRNEYSSNNYTKVEGEFYLASMLKRNTEIICRYFENMYTLLQFGMAEYFLESRSSKKIGARNNNNNGEPADKNEFLVNDEIRMGKIGCDKLNESIKYQSYFEKKVASEYKLRSDKKVELMDILRKDIPLVRDTETVISKVESFGYLKSGRVHSKEQTRSVERLLSVIFSGFTGLAWFNHVSRFGEPRFYEYLISDYDDYREFLRSLYSYSLLDKDAYKLVYRRTIEEIYNGFVAELRYKSLFDVTANLARIYYEDKTNDKDSNFSPRMSNTKVVAEYMDKNSSKLIGECVKYGGKQTYGDTHLIGHEPVSKFIDFEELAYKFYYNVVLKRYEDLKRYDVSGLKTKDWYIDFKNSMIDDIMSKFKQLDMSDFRYYG